MYYEYKDVPPNELHTINGLILQIDKQTNLVKLTRRMNDNGEIGGGKYNEQHSKALLDAWELMKNAHKNYKPNYLDPNYYTGQQSNLTKFKEWQNLYLKEPPKGVIAPWTKKEKAYYESLKTKRERYKYLVIRSGIRSSVIDIPLDAIANIDEEGNMINEEYRELYEIVDENRGVNHISDGYLAMNEWNIAAGMLGDINGFRETNTGHGFTSRMYQVGVLYTQLGNMTEKAHYGYALFNEGQYASPLREAQVKSIVKKIKPDKFGMYPYIDEIIGVDWIMDFNVVDRAATDGKGNNLRIFGGKIQEGKLLDPRDPKSTEQTRREFNNQGFVLDRYDLEFSNDWTQEQVDLYLNIMLLEAKIMAVTPPQGYPNAPTYYIPEYLEGLYKEGKLDSKLDPRIPAIYRESFPAELRQKILDYAKIHNIKD